MIGPKVILELRELDSIKLQTALKIKFTKERPDQEDVITNVFTFNSKNLPVLNERDAKQTLKKHQEYIFKQIDEFMQRGSNWQIDQIVAFYINMSKYKIASGSSYIDLPPYLKNKKAIINVKNKDQECIRWCLRAALGIYKENG